jgi:hypothetical protein
MYQVDAENLLAEAMQMRAGDRTFIGQMEEQEVSLAQVLDCAWLLHIAGPLQILIAK